VQTDKAATPLPAAQRSEEAEQGFIRDAVSEANVSRVCVAAGLGTESHFNRKGAVGYDRR